jgi:hypothetical protein
MARVRNRKLRSFVFGEGKRRKRRRSGRKASGVAAKAKNAPAHCKKGLSVCMTGGGGRSKASGCMRGYWRCIKGG